MDPNENQPGGSSGRIITIHISRQTLILIVALICIATGILITAILLPSSLGNSTTGSTTLALGDTPTAASARATPTIANPTAIPPTLAPTLTSAPVQSIPDTGNYPAPQTPGSNLNGLPQTAIAQAPTIPSLPTMTPPGLPTFAPTRLAQNGGAAPSAAGGLFLQPYPNPSSASQPSNTPVTNPNSTAAPSATTAPGVDTSTPGETPSNDETPSNAVQPPGPSPEVSPTPAETIPTPQPKPTVPVTPRPRPTRRPTAIPVPTEIPIDVLRGNIRWTAAQSPILLKRDQQLVPGATLIIEPGVEVRLAPGVSFFIEGTLYAVGQPDRPVRFIGSEHARWEGLFGRPGSNIGMDYVEIRGGGAGGTVLTSESGNLTMRHTRINDNGGHIQLIDSRLEMRDSEIAGNDMPYGAALEASYSNGGFVIMTNNRIGGNRMAGGSAPVQISERSPADTVNLDVQGNLLVGQDGPNLVLSYNGPFPGGLDRVLPGASPFQGQVSCNTLMNGADGLSIRSEDTQVPRLPINFRDNVIDDHTPPIIPTYLKYGIGRGATSEMVIDMRNNWWGDASGPYEPDRHADGRGDAVGDTVEFEPWLTSRPACAPNP